MKFSSKASWNPANADNLINEYATVAGPAAFCMIPELLITEASSIGLISVYLS